MTLKSAAFLALIGTFLLAVLLVIDLIYDVVGVAGGLIPPVKLVSSLIETFAAVTVVVFFYVFHRRTA
jgi:hypothetical protein